MQTVFPLPVFLSMFCLVTYLEMASASAAEESPDMIDVRKLALLSIPAVAVLRRA